MKEAEKQQSTKTALTREQQGICKGIQQETVVLNKACGAVRLRDSYRCIRIIQAIVIDYF